MLHESNQAYLTVKSHVGGRLTFSATDHQVQAETWSIKIMVQLILLHGHGDSWPSYLKRSKIWSEAALPRISMVVPI